MQESCVPCRHFKQLGSKYFCYLKGSFLASPNSRCGEFSLKMEEDSKKRVLLTREEKKGAQNKKRAEIEVQVKPLGSEEFRLKKELTKLAPKEFYDKEIKKEKGEEQTANSYVVVLIMVLFFVFVLLVLSRL